MNKKIKFVILGLILLLIIFGFYLIYNLTLSDEKMKYCISDEDCVPVECSCSCSGCGGFSYEDIVNKKYINAWYFQNFCFSFGKKSCPMGCCPKRTIACDNNQCVVNELRKIN